MATFEAINQYLTCNLCGGYYNEAYTLPECLHTFCKACITDNFEKQTSGLKVCPQPSCGAQVGRDLDKQPKYDRCLQDCVNQLIPYTFKCLKDDKPVNDWNEVQGSISGTGSSSRNGRNSNNSNSKRRRVGDGMKAGRGNGNR